MYQIDTCCIDKRSSAELSEAINSMYTWYQKAKICYVYLEDVFPDVNIMSNNNEFIHTRWATRGWTLQELLAPSDLVFYSANWAEIGRKDTPSPVLSTITGIDEDVLTGKKALEMTSIAKRMSWAARRNVTRPEDIAYCLMGIFSVNMPMLYGEGGTQAFLRLQEEIMKRSDDHSLFAWTDNGLSSAAYHGLLAEHPDRFKDSHSIFPYEDAEEHASYSISNKGIRMELHITPLTDEKPELYAATLDCPVPPHYENHTFLALYLKKLPGRYNQYARVRVGYFAEAHKWSALKTVYVRQAIVMPNDQSVYPSHVLQLRQFLGDKQSYRVSEVMVPSPGHRGAAITSTQATLGWIPPSFPMAFNILSRGETRASCAIHMVYNETEHFLIIIGSMTGFNIGFTVAELENLDATRATNDLEKVQALYCPKLVGNNWRIGFHDIHVAADLLVRGDAKYYMVDIKLDLINPADTTIDKMGKTTTSTQDPATGVSNQRFRTLRRMFGCFKI
ncbi:MAG: hypothetical protein M1821_002609 [Bathelium mastoideum]|nr:MAG: hypothetical protein M1821_002609 [Bathelium mastoideum]